MAAACRADGLDPVVSTRRSIAQALPKSPENDLKISQSFQIAKMSEPQRFFEFDNFLLDSQQRLLLRDGQPVELTPKVFDVLFELVRSEGRVVEKKDLMERIWPDSFVEEANLTQHVSVLRKKLGQDGQQRYILTVPGRGYRFVAPIKSWDDDAVVTVQERVRSRITVTDDTSLTKPDVETVHTSQRLLPGDAASQRSLSSVWLGAACLLIAAAIIGVGYLVLRRRPPAPPFAKFKLTRFTTEGRVDTAAISTNGKYVAYALGDYGQYSLWIRQTATSNAGVNLVATGNMGYVGLTFSPDNDYIYFTSGPANSPTALYRVPVLGGNRERLVEDVDTPPTFSPDGKRIAYVRGYPDQSQTVLFTAGNDGRGETRLSSLKSRAAELNQAGPSWSPDGESIACSVTVRDDTGQHQEIYVANVRTGEFKPLTNGKWFRIFRVAWTMDGKALVMTASEADSSFAQVWRVSYPSAATSRITNDLSDYRALTMTADSQVVSVVQVDQRTNVFVSPAMDGAASQQITSTNYDGANGLVWTPDGHLIYSATRNGVQDLWITSADGRDRRQLTQNAGQNSSPAVSPDGQTVAFVSTRDDQYHIWKIGLDGSHAQRLTQGTRDTWPVFSADGQWIFYRSVSDIPSSISRVSVNGGSSLRVTDHGIAGPPAISPNGKLIAFSLREPALGPVRIATAPVEAPTGLTLVNSSDPPYRSLVRWANDSKGVVYVKVVAGISNVWLQPIDGSPARQLTNFSDEKIYNFALAADGRLALSRGHEISDVVLISAVN
jgi:eukaryotic-like serine/threonine-protein kinase